VVCCFTCSGRLAAVDKRGEWLAEQGTPQAAANVCWAFATLGVQAPSLLSAVNKRGDWLVNDGTPQNVANMCWAFATLGVRAPLLFAAVEERRQWLAEEGTPQNLANTIANEVTQPLKISNLLSLASTHQDKAYLSILVDSIQNLRDILLQLEDIEQAVGGACSASAFSVLPLIGVFLEVDCGQSRCGLAPPISDSGKAGIREIMTEITNAEEKGLITFRGLHVYQGALQHVRSYQQIAKIR
jgi:hypothetical protein